MANTKITSRVIADNAVTSSAIADGAITEAKLASGVGGVAGIVSSADATAITIDSSETVDITTGVLSTNGAFYYGSPTVAQVSANRNPTTGAIPNASNSSAYLNLNTPAGSSSMEFVLGDAVNTQPSTKMTILGNGNVGIGTTSPDARLHIVNNSSNTFSTSLRLEQTYYTGVYSEIASNFGGAMTINAGQGSGSSSLNIQVNGSEKMKIHSNGSVSIGSSTNLGVLGVVQTGASSTTFALHNDSGTRKWFYLPNAYYGYQGAEEIHANGGVNRYFTNASGTAVGSIVVNAGSTAFNTTSDYRLKDNPQPLTGSGEFIDALQPKTWTWNHGDGGTGVGFIAHEVAEVGLGLCVSGEKDATRIDKVLNEETGEYTEQTVPSYQQLDYSNGELIANMVAELQSLRARIEILENA